MPAPTVEMIQNNLVQTFISNGLTKKAYDDKGNVIDTQELTDEQKKLLKAIAEAINLTWSQWQMTQIIAGQVIVNGIPIPVIPISGPYLP